MEELVTNKPKSAKC